MVFNTESALYYKESVSYRGYCDVTPNVAIDGVFLTIALRLRGVKVDRYHGPDLMYDIMRDRTSYCILVGGSEKNETLVANGFVQEFISLGYHPSTFDLLSEFKLKFEPKFRSNLVFFISLGLPKQEKFAHELRQILEDYYELDATNFRIVPIGAAADFHNGTKMRSGKIWQKVGLEWLPRLFREPRMWIRNVRSLLAFILVATGK